MCAVPVSMTFVAKSVVPLFSFAILASVVATKLGDSEPPQRGTLQP